MAYEEHEVGAWYVRTNKVRLAAPGVWEEIIRQWQRNNFHLPLPLLASKMTDAQLDAIHDGQLGSKLKRVKDE